MNLIIGGDLVPYGESVEQFKNGDVRAILGDDLFEIWNSADYKLFNLECPITSERSKISKCGPNIKCDPGTIGGIKGLAPSCIMLANNHILDYSERGLSDTVDILNENSIDWVGIGTKGNAIKKTFSFTCGNKKITIFNCCEHEFSVVPYEQYGANPYDDNSIGCDLANAKATCDYLVVVYHGGKEHYRYPSPVLQKRCRRMISEGADLVICQHSHCVGCEEEFMGKKIIYGQGNFVFNMKKNEFWNTSILIDIDISDNYSISYIPIMQSMKGVRLANSAEAKEILDGFKKRSIEIKKTSFVQNKYREYAKKELPRYMNMVNRSVFLRIIHKVSPHLYNKINFDYSAILNVVECEAHNELFAEGLRCKIMEKSKKSEN